MSLASDFATLTSLALNHREIVEELVRKLTSALSRGDHVTLAVRPRELDETLDYEPRGEDR